MGSSVKCFLTEPSEAEDLARSEWSQAVARTTSKKVPGRPLRFRTGSTQRWQCGNRTPEASQDRDSRGQCRLASPDWLISSPRHGKFASVVILLTTEVARKDRSTPIKQKGNRASACSPPLPAFPWGRHYWSLEEPVPQRYRPGVYCKRRIATTTQHSEISMPPRPSQFIAEMQMSDYIRCTLGQEGFVSVNLLPGDRTVALQNLTHLMSLFGGCVAHKHDRDGFVDLTTNPGYYDSTIRRPQSDNGPQAPHVDGSVSSAPAVVATYCITPACSGGETLIVDLEEAFLAILEAHPSDLRSLFRPDAVTIRRGSRSSSRALFHLDHNVLRCFYSNHEYNEVTPHPVAQRGFRFIDDFVKDPNNQRVIKTEPGQIMLFANNRIAHGRRGFTDKPNAWRHFVRAWYDGYLLEPGVASILLTDQVRIKTVSLCM